MTTVWTEHERELRVRRIKYALRQKSGRHDDLTSGQHPDDPPIPEDEWDGTDEGDDDSRPS